jgi:ribosomal protein S18 acetylase RimI-like enzyme
MILRTLNPWRRRARSDRSGVRELPIREATLDDAAEIAAFMNKLGEEKLDTINPRTHITVEREREFLQEALDNPRAFYLIALDGESIAGMVDLHSGLKAHENHAAKLGISVSREWRGRGLGRRLMCEAIAKTKRWEGFCRIELEVVPWNVNAIALYENLGFVREAVKKKGVNLRGCPEDEYQMALVW